MGELNDVLKSISEHCSVEIHDNYSNPSIGRGEIMMTAMQRPKTIWIVNREPESTHALSRNITGDVVGTYESGIKHTYQIPGELAVSNIVA